MRLLPLPIFILLFLSGCTDSPPGDATNRQGGEGAPLRDEAPIGIPDPGRAEDLRASVDPVGEIPPSEVPQDAPGGGDSVDGGNPDGEGGGGPAGEESGEPGARPVPDGEGTVRFPKPEHVRGIYLNAWTAGSWTRRTRLFDMVRQTELNSVVIDIKDASGHVSHDSQNPLARGVGATGQIRIRDLAGLLDQLEAAGIYPIARIVVAKDPILAEGRPELAIQDSAGGPWLDQKEVKWLNLFDQRVWDYHVQLAQEVVDAGFPEIQWDYVRFPDAPESLLSRAVFPGSEGRTKAQAVREFLGYSRRVLRAEGARVTADVFGVTTSYRRDVGIGQLWESFIDQVDVALPMVYPSHYWTGSFGYRKPNAHPYEIVRRALRDALSRSGMVEGAGATRPWLQDFSLGDPPYGSPEVRAQIQATYDAGIREWILWNPGSRYTEAALIPARGLPSWLEPVIRVGGQVVAVSKRYEVLGEAAPPGIQGSESSRVMEVPSAPAPRALPGARPMPTVPIPDTVRRSDSTPPMRGRIGARGGGHRGPVSPGAPGGSPLP
jgi:hypothetical protein